MFDGEKREPYTEAHVARPISVYGASKREGERLALEANDRALIVRVSWVFGPDRPSFIDWAMKQAREHDEVKAISDKVATPTYTLDLAQLLKLLLRTQTRRVCCIWRMAANAAGRNTRSGLSIVAARKVFRSKRATSARPGSKR